MPSRESYLRFLARMGYEEEEVLSLFTDREAEKVRRLEKILDALAQIDDLKYRAVLDEASNAKLQSALLRADANTNFLLNRLCREICADFAKLGVSISDKVYAGVFPTYSFNAQARKEDDGYLVLLDTGCFETIETAVTVLLGPWTDNQKTKMLAGAIQNYCRHGKLTRSEDLEQIRTRKQNGIEIARDLETAEQITPLLTNACERFVIAHEYGHIINEHLEGALHRTLREDDELLVIVKDPEQEFEADLWALHMLIRQTDMHDARMRLITYTGAVTSLGLGLLVEDFQKTERKGSAPNDSHPPALERMRLLQAYYERLSWDLDFKGSGRIDSSLLRMLSACSVSLGGSGIPLCKSTSVETLTKTPSEHAQSARQLAQLLGAPLSSHERIVSLEKDGEIVKGFLKKMKVDPLKPSKSPLAVALEAIDRTVLWVFWGFQFLLATAAVAWFSFTGGLLLPALLIIVALSLFAAYARYFRDL